MKMTLKEFWESKENWYINCRTEDQAIKFCEESHKLGKSWRTGKSYLKENYWDDYKQKTCYLNNATFCSITVLKYMGYTYKILHFEDIEWDEKQTPMIDKLEFNRAFIKFNPDNLEVSSSINNAIIKVQHRIDDELMKTLYEIYKDDNISTLYVINENQFKRYVLETLPGYLENKDKKEGE